MTDLVLHIGLAKTGTTALQESLVLNRDWLSDRGWCYPVSADGRRNHNGLVTTIGDLPLDPESPRRGRFKTEGLTRLLGQIERSGNRGILSAEMFPLLVENEIERLAELLDAYEVTVTVHLRRPDELIRSLWAQMIGMLATTETFPAFARNRMGSTASIADFATVLEPWRNVFGDDALVPMLHEPDGHIQRFYERWFGTTDGVVGPAELNVSNASRLVPEGLRRMAFHLGDMDSDARVVIGNQARHAPVARGWFGEPFQPLTRGLAREILDHHRERNLEIAQTYFGRDDLFPDTSETLDRLPATIPSLEDEVDIEALQVFELAAMMLRRHEQRLREAHARPL